jgi:hypothetical protein
MAGQRQASWPEPGRRCHRFPVSMGAPLQNKRSWRAPCGGRRSCCARGSLVRVPPPHPPPAPPMSMLPPRGSQTRAK